MPDSRRNGGCTKQIGAGRTEVARDKLRSYQVKVKR